MQILAVVRRRTERFSTEAFGPYLDAEAERVREFYAEGIVRGAWTRDDVPGACLLLECASMDDAEAHMRTLPFVQREMSEYQLIPLRGYRGFGPR